MYSFELCQQILPVKLSGILRDVIHSSCELIDNRAVFSAALDKSCDLYGAPASCFNQLSRLLAVPIVVDSISMPSQGQNSFKPRCVGAILMLRSEWNWDPDHAQHVHAVAMSAAHALPLVLPL
jgi:hypothetical protein